MNADLGISTAAFGFATGMFSARYIALQIPGNLVLNRLGPQRWLGLLTIAWGVVAMLTSLVQGERSLVVVRIALGAVEAGLLPGMFMYLTIWFPPRMRGRITAVVCLPFYAILGTPPSAYIIQYADGMSGLAGWRWMFLLEGAPTILIGLLLLRFLTDSPATATWLSAEEKAALLRITAAQQTDEKPRTGLRDIPEWLRDLRLVTLSMAVGLLWVGFAAITSFLPLIIAGFAEHTHTRLSLVQTGLLSGLVHVPAALVALVWDSSSDRRDERVKHVVGGTLLAAAGTVLAVNASNLWVTLLGTVLLTSGIYAALFDSARRPGSDSTKAAGSPTSASTTASFSRDDPLLATRTAQRLPGRGPHPAPGRSAALRGAEDAAGDRLDGSRRYRGGHARLAR